MEVDLLTLVVCVILGLILTLIWWMVKAKNDMEEKGDKKEKEFIDLIAKSIGAVTNQVTTQVDSKVAAINTQVNNNVNDIKLEIKNTVENVQLKIQNEMLKSMLEMKNQVQNTVSDTIGKVRQDVEQTVSHNVDRIMAKVETTKAELVGKASIVNWFSENPIMVAFGIGAIASLVMKYMAKDKFRGEASINQFDTPFQKGMKVAALILDYLIGIGIIVGATVGFVSNAKYNALKDVGQLGLSIVGKAKNVMGFFTDKKLDDDKTIGVAIHKSKEEIAAKELEKIIACNGKTETDKKLNGECQEIIVGDTKCYGYDIQYYLFTFNFSGSLCFEKFKRPLETEKDPRVLLVSNDIVKVLTIIKIQFQDSRNYICGIHKYKIGMNGYISLRLTQAQLADLVVRMEDALWKSDFAYVLADNIPGFIANNSFVVFPMVGGLSNPNTAIISKSVYDPNNLDQSQLVPIQELPKNFSRDKGFMGNYWMADCEPFTIMRIYYKRDRKVLKDKTVEKRMEPNMEGTKFKLVSQNPNLEVITASTVQLEKSFVPEIMVSFPLDPFAVKEKVKIDLTQKKGFGKKLKDIVTSIEIKDKTFWIVVVGGVFLIVVLGIGIGWYCNSGNASNKEKRMKRRGEAKKHSIKEKPFYIPSAELLQHDHYAKKKLIQRESEGCPKCDKMIFIPYLRSHLSICSQDDKGKIKYQNFSDDAYYCPHCQLNVFDWDWEWHCREMHPDWTGGFFCDDEVTKLKEAGVKNLEKYVLIKAPQLNKDYFRGGNFHKELIDNMNVEFWKPLGKIANKSIEELKAIAAKKFNVVPLNHQIKMDPGSEVIYNVTTGVIGYIDPASDDIVVQKQVPGDYTEHPKPSITMEGESAPEQTKQVVSNLKEEFVVSGKTKIYRPTGRTKEQVTSAVTKDGKETKVRHEPGTPKMSFTCRVCKKLLPFVEKLEKQVAWNHFKECKESKKGKKQIAEANVVKLDPKKIEMNYGESQHENMKTCKNCSAIVKTSRLNNHLAKCPVLGKKQGEGRNWNTYHGTEERGTAYGRKGGGNKRKNRLGGYQNQALGITTSRNQELRAARAKRAQRTRGGGVLGNINNMLRWDWYKVDPKTEINEEELERKEEIRNKLAAAAQQEGWNQGQFLKYARELDDYIYNARMVLSYENENDGYKSEAAGEAGSDKMIPCRLCMVNDNQPNIVLVPKSKMREHNKQVHKCNGPFRHFKSNGEGVNILPDSVSDNIFKTRGECALLDKHEPYFEDDFKASPQFGGESVTPDCMKFKNEDARKHMIEVTYVEIDKPTHHAWGFRHNNLFYLGAHVLHKADREKLFVNLPGKVVKFNDFVKETFAVVQDNVLYVVKQEYKVDFEKVANTKFFMPDHQDITYKMMFTGTETALFVEEMTPNRILTPGSGNAEYYVTCAIYSSNPGDSGSLVWGYDRKKTLWVPIGVHFGDSGGKRMFYTFFAPQPTYTNLN